MSGLPHGAARPRPEDEDETREEFGELIRYTLAGWLGGLAAAVVLDGRGFQRSGAGQWLVRTLAGEGESLLEGLYAFRQRLRSRAVGMAEVYGWGKLLGMAAPWVIDWVSRRAGVDVYGTSAFYIPFFYAMSDQIGGNFSGLLFLRRRYGGWARGLAAYLRHPVMVTGLAVIFTVPAGLLVARLAGFSPTTQVSTALETIVANLCWLPPAVGWWRERGAG